VTQLDDYRRHLHELSDWIPFLLRESNLPGPRGNLELAQAVAREASARQVRTFLSIPTEQAPENTPQVFVVFCGVLSLGRLIAAGEKKHIAQLRRYASDPRWRIREAVAMALQTIGDTDMSLLVRQMNHWCQGNWLEKRAAAAGLCEPRLLKDASVVKAVLNILDLITASMVGAGNRNAEAFRALRQGMGYCWSVAVAADLRVGKPLMERWLKSKDPDVRWLLKENLSKNRLVKADPRWVKSCIARLRS